MKAITFVKGDITTQDINVIVNAANEKLPGGGGVDGAIHEAAGADLLKAHNAQHNPEGCEPGQAVVTPGFDLPADFIIHTVGPRYANYNYNDAAGVLEQCYWNSLQACLNVGQNRIAFPAISTGIFGFPLEDATMIAIGQAMEFFDHYNLPYGFEVRFMCFDDAMLDLYTKTHADMTRFMLETA